MPQQPKIPLRKMHEMDVAYTDLQGRSGKSGFAETLFMHKTQLESVLKHEHKSNRNS